MLKDATAATNGKDEIVIIVGAGETFDLNGYYVETDNLLSFGSVIDTADVTGGIKISSNTAEAWTQLQPENSGYLPIYDTNTGSYKFFEGYINSYGAYNGTSTSIQFWFQIFFSKAEGYTILANTASSNLNVVLNMNWTGITGFDVSYIMSDANVKKFATNVCNGTINVDGTHNQGMFLKVGGLDKVGSGGVITAQPAIVSRTEVVDIASTTMKYNIP